MWFEVNWNEKIIQRISIKDNRRTLKQNYKLMKLFC